MTAANHVFHITRTWNPATENQATDRAYRIGQKRDVTVHIPYLSHLGFTCLDVRLNNLMKTKQSLVEQVIRPTKSSNVNWREMEDCFDEDLEMLSPNEVEPVEYTIPTNLHPTASKLYQDSRFTDALRRNNLPVNDALTIVSFLLWTPTSKQKLCRTFFWDQDLLMSKLTKLQRVLIESGIGNIGLIENPLVLTMYE